MRINQPQLPHADPGNKWAAKPAAQLQKTLLAVVTQLNALSDGGINAQTSAATAAPTTGVHAQGDFIRNSKPAASSIVRLGVRDKRHARRVESSFDWSMSHASDL